MGDIPRCYSPPKLRQSQKRTEFNANSAPAEAKVDVELIKICDQDESIFKSIRLVVITRTALPGTIKSG